MTEAAGIEADRQRRTWPLAASVAALAAALLALAAFGAESPAAVKLLLADAQSLPVEHLSIAGVFLLLAAATLVSEDLACIAAGVLAAQGRIGFALAVASCAFGIFAGDLLIYLAGRVFGRRILRTRLAARFVSEQAFERGSAWLAAEGLKTVFISRFVFGLRLPLYFAAGALKTPAWRFTLYFGLAVAVWTPLLVGAAYGLGAAAVENALFNEYAWLVWPATAAALLVALRVATRLATFRGRRIFWGRLKRRFIWEFWSIRIFYAPVVVYIAYLAARFRSPTVFTCANPAIPAGGFVGESKREILDGLAQSEAAAPFLLEYLFLPRTGTAAENLAAARRFMRERDLRFPVVVKPDVGERGAGVEIAADELRLRALVEAARGDLIVQEYAAGDEASVFYCRRPENKTGEIFAITEKRFPSVTGDGRATLERLILRDARAVCLAESYLARNEDELERVPAPGERVPIIDIGTHSRGAIFLDGGWMKTPELAAAIDAICRGYEGFYFGRFDIRVASFDDFRRAVNFRIVELNGVTSEATNIYDPKNSILDAYRTLFRQWRLAFEIGAANRKRGARAASVTDLLKLTFKRKPDSKNP